MSYRDSERFRKVYSYYRPVPRATDPSGVSKEYVDDSIRAIDWKQSVRYATTGAINVSTHTTDPIDGAAPIADEDRILVKDQSSAAENGIYIYNTSSGQLSRTLDATQDALTCGAMVYVEEGGTNIGKVFVLSTADPITVGTTEQTWTEFGGVGGGGDSFWSSTTAGSVYTTGSVAIRGGSTGVDSPSDIGSDVFFWVSGSITGSRKSVFGGDVVMSGSLQFGDETFALGLRSHAQGKLTIASGPYSHAEGIGIPDLGEGGAYTTAEGTGSHAEGYGSLAVGYASHAEGWETHAVASFCHTEGSSTYAYGTGSHAEGAGCEAWGNYSHAEGDETFAIGVASHAEGRATIASGTFQLAIGKYNKQGNDFSLFVVGDGVDEFQGRSDIFRINSGTVGGTGIVEVTGSFAVEGPYIFNVQSGTLGTEPVILLVSSSHHVTVFTKNIVTASLPVSSPVGTKLVFKDGTGAAATSPQMLSSSTGKIDGTATYTLPATNYSSATVVKVNANPETWVKI